MMIVFSRHIYQRLLIHTLARARYMLHESHMGPWRKMIFTTKSALVSTAGLINDALWVEAKPAESVMERGLFVVMFYIHNKDVIVMKALAYT